MVDIWEKPCQYTPSLITLDLCNLESQVRIVEQEGFDMLHVDILDGHFSPSMPLGLETVGQLRDRTDLAFDCHLMVTEQDYFVDSLLDIGVQQLVFHAETQPHIDGMINRIHAKGCRAGIALKPATPLSTLEYVLEKCDTVLLMLINPGYAFVKGEKPVPYGERKIMELRKMIDDRGLKTKISVDGRISPEIVRKYGAGTVDQFVLGSTCFKKGPQMVEDIRNMMKLRKELVEAK